MNLKNDVENMSREVKKGNIKFDAFSKNCSWFVLEALKGANIKHPLKPGGPFPDVDQEMLDRHKSLIATSGSLGAQIDKLNKK